MSPVIAAIILIAVTVAVSIAVAAWMGALTFTFMGTEQLQITGHHSWNVAGGTVILNLTNSGSAKLTLSAVEVSGSPATFTVSWSSGTLDSIMDPGEKTAITVNKGSAFTAGVTYEIVVITASGKRFGPYLALAPS